MDEIGRSARDVLADVPALAGGEGVTVGGVVEHPLAAHLVVVGDGRSVSLPRPIGTCRAGNSGSEIKATG